MLQKVSLTPKKLKTYEKIIDEKLFKEIIDLSKELKNLKVLHINTTRLGGGVAELLNNLVPLMRNVGLKAEWQTIVADDRLFKITKSFHNAFQGANYKITKEIERTYKRFNAYNAHLIEGKWDIIQIHDPQPAAIPYYYTGNKVKWIWRCHIDTSNPNKRVWEFFKPFLCEYDIAVFTLKEFLPKDLPIKKEVFITPAIDPLAPKNEPLTDFIAKKIISSYSVDIARPIITQVSRFDPWKDPIGVIKAYKIAKEIIPKLQLVLIGSMATDDPEGWGIYKKVERFKKKDKDIHVLTNLGDVEVDAFQTGSDIVIQKSVREGFGLTVAEAMWKGTPVIGGKAGGIKTQIINDKTGYLVSSIKQCAQRIVYLLEHPDIAEKIAENGREYVRKNFLLPRLLRDNLKIYASLVRPRRK